MSTIVTWVILVKVISAFLGEMCLIVLDNIFFPYDNNTLCFNNLSFY